VVLESAALNETELAEKVKLLPQKALETLARDVRAVERRIGLSEPFFEPKSVRAHMTFVLSAEVVEQLNGLYEQGQDVNRIILELLQKRRDEIAERKQALSASMGVSIRRAIPAKVKRVCTMNSGRSARFRSTRKLASSRFHLICPLIALFSALCKGHHQRSCGGH
jgi:hypothetical protein